jgi:hypothetical protein
MLNSHISLIRRDGEEIKLNPAEILKVVGIILQIVMLHDAESQSTERPFFLSVRVCCHCVSM